MDMNFHSPADSHLPVRSEQLVDFPIAEIHQRKRSPCGPRKMRIQFQSQAVENRGNDIARLHRTIRRNAANGVTGSDRLSAFHATARETHSEALGPVIPSASRVYFGGTAKLGQVANQSVAEQTPLMQIFDQG